MNDRIADAVREPAQQRQPVPLRSPGLVQQRRASSEQVAIERQTTHMGAAYRYAHAVVARRLSLDRHLWLDAGASDALAGQLENASAVAPATSASDIRTHSLLQKCEIRNAVITRLVTVGCNGETLEAADEG
nr:hypothetical protein [Paraburkholderia youngii]